MRRVCAQTTILLLEGIRDLCPLSAKARQAVGGLTAVVAVVLCSSLTNGGVHWAQAEPLVTAGSKRWIAAHPFAAFVAEAALRFGIPTHWINTVMMEESGGEVRAISPQGAMGLMQIMPDTWNDLRSRLGLGANPFEPHDNILAGAAYLREMYDRYGSPGFIAAYNAGPARYEESLATGRGLPPETQLYVAVVAPMVGAAQVDGTVAIARRAIPWQDAPLFAALGPDGSSGKSSLARLRSSSASVGRSTAAPPSLSPRAAGLFVGRATAGPTR